MKGRPFVTFLGVCLIGGLAKVFGYMDIFVIATLSYILVYIFERGWTEGN